MFLHTAKVGLGIAAVLLGAGCGKLHFDEQARDADVPLIDGDAFIPDPDACVGCGDLVAYFRFDEGAGNRTVDAIDPSSRIAMLSSGVTWVPGRHGTAVKFDGNTGKITTAAVPQLDNVLAFTYAAWINIIDDGKNGFGVIVAKGGSGPTAGRRFLLNRQSFCTQAADCVELSVGRETDDADLLTEADFAEPAKWHYITATYDAASGPHVYQDGVEPTYLEGPTMGAGAFLDDTATPYLIGGWQNISTGGAYNGLIDDLRIYTRALSPAEVVNLYAEAQLDQ
ncbi:MAG TPA: LamG domain-containing protein [Kofleriaceae bacterium]